MSHDTQADAAGTGDTGSPPVCGEKEVLLAQETAECNGRLLNRGMCEGLCAD